MTLPRDSFRAFRRRLLLHCGLLSAAGAGLATLVAGVTAGAGFGIGAASSLAALHLRGRALQRWASQAGSRPPRAWLLGGVLRAAAVLCAVLNPHLSLAYTVAGLFIVQAVLFSLHLPAAQHTAT